MPASFDLQAVERAIVGTRFAGCVQHFAQVGSTNQSGLEAAAAGARGGVWVADEQTAGRGRGGHTWHSVVGDGLYVSALVMPRVPLSHAARIPLATGLAGKAAIDEVTGLGADIRWPNDLMMGERKCGGVLVESASEGTMLRYAVIGVGINVNHESFPRELARQATSLRIEGGSEFAREPLLAALLRHLDDEVERLEQAWLENRDGEELLRRFAAASSWVRGKRVRVGEAEGYTGTTRGLDREGFLLVQDDHGTLRTVLSGGVRPE